MSVEISSPGLKAVSISADCIVSPKRSNLPSFIEGFASASVNKQKGN